ncbi:hypothetical protein MTR55_25055, partial [Escherichia coli]|nr:hypothetical protein [Escherichia coli]
MKKTPWEKWEVDFLREVAATMPVEVIAEKLERTEKAVMAKATRIGAVNRPGFPGECFICELRLPDHCFRWKHNKLFLLL